MKNASLIYTCIFLALWQAGSPLTFWHITDTHIDWAYKENSRPILGQCRWLKGHTGKFGD